MIFLKKFKDYTTSIVRFYSTEKNKNQLHKIILKKNKKSVLHFL